MKCEKNMRKLSEQKYKIIENMGKRQKRQEDKKKKTK